MLGLPIDHHGIPTGLSAWLHESDMASSMGLLRHHRTTMAHHGTAMRLPGSCHRTAMRYHGASVVLPWDYSDMTLQYTMGLPLFFMSCREGSHGTAMACHGMPFDACHRFPSFPEDSYGTVVRCYVVPWDALGFPQDYYSCTIPLSVLYPRHSSWTPRDISREFRGSFYWQFHDRWLHQKLQNHRILYR